MKYFVLVHGTGDDNARIPGDERAWWAPNSYFNKILKKNLEAQGLNSSAQYIIDVFEWGGANSERARMRGAKALASHIRKLDAVTTTEENVFVIIAHSHGGNVAIDALAQLDAKNPSTRSQVSADPKVRLVLVGTPVFNYNKGKLLFWPTAPSIIWRGWRNLDLNLFDFDRAEPGFFLRFMTRNVLRAALLPGLVFFFWFLSARLKTPEYVLALKTFLGATRLGSVIDVVGNLLSFFRPAWLLLSAGMHLSVTEVGLGVLALTPFLMLPFAQRAFRQIKRREEAIEAALNYDTSEGVASVDDEPAQFAGLRAASEATAGSSAESSNNLDKKEYDTASQTSGPVPTDTQLKISEGDNKGSSSETVTEQPPRTPSNFDKSADNFTKPMLASVLAIYSEDDEAILGLSRLVSLKSLDIFRYPYLMWLVRGALFLGLASWGGFTSLYESSPGTFNAAPLMYAAILFTAIYPLSGVISWILSLGLNRVIGIFLRKFALGDDLTGRVVTSVTPYLFPAKPSPPLNAYYAQPQQTHIGEAARAAWMRAKEFLVIAQFTGDRKLFSALQNNGGLSWDALIHTTYFKVPMTAHLIAYCAIRQAITSMPNGGMTYVAPERALPTATAAASPTYAETYLKNGKNLAADYSELRGRPPQARPWVEGPVAAPMVGDDKIYRVKIEGQLCLE